MSRWTRCIAIGLICGTPCAVSAQRSPETDPQSEILNRLNLILNRLERIETRLSQLEATEEKRNWTIDENGVIRTRSGQPIGFWGIDEPRSVIVKRR